MTTALYSMAGLGSLEKSKMFKNLQQQHQPLEALEHESRNKAKGENEEGDNKDVGGTDSLGLDEEEEDLATGSSSMIAGQGGAKNIGGRQQDHQQLQGPEMSKVIDILLVESDTIWMLELSGK